MNKITDQREKDIQLLCRVIVNSGLDFYDNPNGAYEYTCPYCGVREHVGGEDERPIMSTIGHKQNCAYLVAKDLSTNLR